MVRKRKTAALQQDTSTPLSCDVNLEGRICPYPVMHILFESEQMQAGETRTYLVDDPLAIKSVPEELEEYANHSVSIKPQGNMWKITVTRNT